MNNKRNSKTETNKTHLYGIPREQPTGRLRRTGSISDCAHQWANPRYVDDYSSGGNVSFCGDEFISYNTVVAKSFRQHGFYLLSEERYSVTTSRHLREASSAQHGLTEIVVPYVDPRNDNQHLENAQYLRWAMIEQCKNLMGGQSYNYWSELFVIAKKYVDYVLAFKLRRFMSTNDKRLVKLIVSRIDKEGDHRPTASLGAVPKSSIDWENDCIAQTRKTMGNDIGKILAHHLGFIVDESECHSNPFDIFQSAIRSARIVDAYQMEEEHRRNYRQDMSSTERRLWNKMSDVEQVNKWRMREQPAISNLPAASSNYPDFGVKHRTNNYYSYSSGDFLRLSKDGNKIETSGRATVTVKECRILWKRYLKTLWKLRNNRVAFLALVDQLTKWSNDNRLARSFRIDDVDVRNGSVTIGCHRIPFQELAKMAIVLGMEDRELQWSPVCLPAPKSIPFPQVTKYLNSTKEK